jgi:hypothetical protein
VAVRNWHPGQLAIAWAAGALAAALVFGGYAMWSRRADMASADLGIYAAQAIAPPGTPIGMEPEWVRAEKRRRWAAFEEALWKEHNTRRWLQPLAYSLAFGVIPAGLLAVTWVWFGARRRE